MSGNLRIKVGIYENQPKIYTNDQGEVSGFWGDITNYLAMKEGWKIEWVHGNWDKCLELLKNDKIDMMVDVAFSPERSEIFDFQEETVYLSWSVLYIGKDKEFNTILDLDGKKIGALKNSFNLEGPGNFKEMLNKFDLNCEIFELEDYLSIFKSIDAGEFYGGITNKDFGYLHEEKYGVKRTSLIFQPAHIKYAFPKGSKLSEQLIPIIDQRIIELKSNKNSIYYHLLDKNLGGSREIRIFPLWLKILLGIVIILALIFFVFFWILKYKVRQKTKELKIYIEKLQKMQEELQLMVNRWETTFNSIKDVIMLINNKNVIENINQTGLDKLRVCRDAVIGKKLEEFFPDLDNAESDFPIKRAFLCNSTSISEYRDQCLEKYFTVKCSPIFDDNREVSKLVVLLEDISERKKSEMKLKDYQENLEKIIEERTKNLEKKNQYLQHYIKLFENREFRIKELRDELSLLKKELEKKNK